MPSTFVALLRSINVGRRRVPMETLREKFVELGFSDVRTYVQSGNVVFEASRAKPEVVAARIEKMMSETFGFEVPTIVRTSDELAGVATAHPFRPLSPDDSSKLHVTFLASQPVDARRVAALATGLDKVQIVGREVYLHVPGSYAETPLSNGALEKALGVVATTRNLRTVDKLVELCR